MVDYSDDEAHSAETQEILRRLLGRLTSVDGWNEGETGEEVQALTDVVERWDAHDYVRRLRKSAREQRAERV